MRGVLKVGMMGAFLIVAAAMPVGAQVPAGAGPGSEAAPANPYTPPACVPGVPFADVTCSTPFDAWIEQFAADGITVGCGGGDYCPFGTVTREEMAVFIEAAMHGTGSWSPGDQGNYNTAIGNEALLNNSPYAEDNTALGFQALYTQSYAGGNGFYIAANTAIGLQALYFNQPDGGNGGQDGTNNTAVGVDSLFYNSTGWGNTAVGEGSGISTSTGSFNTFVGLLADAASGNLVDATALGYNAVVDASYHVRIGDNSVTQIGGKVAWSNLSDERAKQDIQDLDLGLDFVMSLRPVSFQLIKGNGRTDMGFIAQDVEALLGDGYNVLGIGQDKDRTLSLRYTDFIAPMVKAIQQQQSQIGQQQSRIQQQQSQIQQQQTQMEGRDQRIQQLESDVATLKTQVQALLAERGSVGGASQQ